MIERRTADGWIVLLDDDGEREVLRFKLPADWHTMTQGEQAVAIDAFVEHLRKLARNNQHGPS